LEEKPKKEIAMVDMFHPTELNGLTLANRFIRSATWEGLATDEGACSPRLIDVMAGLAAGGVGLIITGHAYVHQYGQHSPWQLGIHQDELIPSLRRMTDAVHAAGGKIVVQIGYGGAYLSKSRLRSMTVQDIQKVVRAFAGAAERAQTAGFDGVQIFAAHGFLLGQFLCPRYNDRSDAYGGCIENRARCLLEVLASIRTTVGRSYPVLVKLNCRDFVENGLCLEDSVRVGIMLAEGGVDAIELSGGLLNNPNLLREKILSETDEAYFRGEAIAFKQKINIPLILVGGIRSYHVAKQLVDEGVADYISMCRPFIREPDLIHRWQSGNHQRAACISCNGCVEQVKQGKGIQCLPLDDVSAETFFPQLTEDVPASPPHPPGTSYRISLGLEQWDSQYLPVVKVQMAFNGKTSERSLSFPLGTQDHANVQQAVQRLIVKHTTG
jgi:2,4-dienoyl-CoA reductase-like NADH-dependent reductase (Old Yellow Enzyme family)